MFKSTDEYRDTDNKKVYDVCVKILIMVSYRRDTSNCEIAEMKNMLTERGSMFSLGKSSSGL